jgi:hypothetical protein
VETLGTDERRRLLVVTPGNLRQSHLYIHKHYDFFPPDCVGPSRKSAAANSGKVEIFLDGLNETVKTDIARDSKSGKPRAFFRERAWVRRLFEYHKISAGDMLALERVATRRYRLCPQSHNGQTPTAAEFYSDIGLLRLALERRGWPTYRSASSFFKC